MDYTPENIDIPAFEEALRDERRYQQNELRIACEKAEAYFRGFEGCITCVSSMLHCSNYESAEKRTKSFLAGADAAFYELCKELSVASQDVRDMNASVDEKAALLAERIKVALSGTAREDEKGE